MIQLRVFVFVAIALFLADCSCAVATDAPADINKAKKAVTELQELTARVLGHAEAKFRAAKSTESTVEAQKGKADNAEADAKKAAAAIKAKERKKEADEVAKEAQKELGNCNTLYAEAKKKAEEASTALNGFVTKAKALVQNAKIDIPAAPSQGDNYAQVIASAGTVTSETTRLSEQLNASTVLGTADIELSALKEGAKKVQVLKYQAESLVIVSRIETKMSDVETDILSIQQNKDKINTIAEEMDKTFQSAPDTSKVFFNSLCNNARSFLRTATKKITEANKCKNDMLEKKQQLDATLETLKATTDESVANTQAERVKWHEGLIDGEIEKIKEALGGAENAFSSAESVRQQMKDEVSTKKSQSGSEIDKEKQQDNVHTAEVTNPIRSGEAKPAITETAKTVIGKSEDTLNKPSEQPVDAPLDKTKENKSTQLTDKEKQNPTDDNSELLNNDTLRKMTKNMTNNSLIGGEVPTRSAANDSAVTVFIPLLVILIVSAVLH